MSTGGGGYSPSPCLRRFSSEPTPPSDWGRLPLYLPMALVAIACESVVARRAARFTHVTPGEPGHNTGKKIPVHVRKPIDFTAKASHDLNLQPMFIMHVYNSTHDELEARARIPRELAPAANGVRCCWGSAWRRNDHIERQACTRFHE
jgi:hypothetical protein